MSRFDRTNNAQIGRMIDEKGYYPKVGKITEVYEHIEQDDYSNFFVDVDIPGENDNRTIPYQFRANDDVAVPRAGDTVIVEYLDSAEKLPTARSIMFTNEDRPPLARAGEWKKRIPSFGDSNLYVESYTSYDGDPSSEDVADLTPQEAHLRLTKKTSDDQNSDFPMAIELFDSETESYIEISLAGGWGLRINAQTGEFKLLDEQGYGIVSDGAGNFTWHHQSIDFSEGTTDTL